MNESEWSWVVLKARAARHCSWCGLAIHAGAGFWLGSKRRTSSRACRVCRECEGRRWQLEAGA